MIVFNMITFEGNGGDYTGGLYAIRPGQAHPRQLTTNPWDNDPSFAPSGKKLVFRRTNTSRPGIYLLDIDSGRANRLLPRESDLDPSLGPDGMIVFLRFSRQTRSYDLFLRSRAGHVRRLTSTTAKEEEPIFAPDGKRIVFVRRYGRAVLLAGGERVPYPALYSIRVDGSGLRRIGSARQGANFDVSPDGRHLLFSILGKVTMDSVESEVRTRPINGGESRLVSDNAQYPTYSPGGHKIAYSNHEGLWIRRADGRGTPTRVFKTDYRPYEKGGTFLIQPAWQPLP